MQLEANCVNENMLLAGSIIRIGDTNDIYLIENSFLQESGKIKLYMTNMAGQYVEKVIDTGQVVSIGAQRATQSTFFEQRIVCPLCSHSVKDSKRLFSIRQIFWNVDVKECCHCGMAYKDPIANSGMLESIYTSNYEHLKPSEIKINNSILYRSRIRRLGKVRGRHLDYGCGNGSFVEAALNAGWDSYGGDPFLQVVPTTSPLNGRLFQMDASDIKSITSIGKFDIISMWAVVEHFTSFKHTISGLVKLLNPYGKIIFNSPNAHSLIAKRCGSSWRMATLIEHLQFCTPLAIKWLSKDLGLKIQSLRICGAPYPTGKSKGASDQGICSLPFSIGSLNDFNGLRSDLKGKSNIGNTGKMLAKMLNGVQSSRILGELAKIFIAYSRLGDHIEVILAKEN